VPDTPELAYKQRIVDNTHGICTGQEFANFYAPSGWIAYTRRQQIILQEGPANSQYAHTWEQVLLHARCPDSLGKYWSLLWESDGALYLVR
jgi:hypothetical protein